MSRGIRRLRYQLNPILGKELVHGIQDDVPVLLIHGVDGRMILVGGGIKGNREKGDFVRAHEFGVLVLDLYELRAQIVEFVGVGNGTINVFDDHIV